MLEIKENSNNLLNCSLKRQNAVDFKKPVKLSKNFDGISISFNLVKRILWPYNKVKQRNIFGHSVGWRKVQNSVCVCGEGSMTILMEHSGAQSRECSFLPKKFMSTTSFFIRL